MNSRMLLNKFNISEADKKIVVLAKIERAARRKVESS